MSTTGHEVTIHFKTAQQAKRAAGILYNVELLTGDVGQSQSYDCVASCVVRHSEGLNATKKVSVVRRMFVDLPGFQGAGIRFVTLSEAS